MTRRALPAFALTIPFRPEPDRDVMLAGVLDDQFVLDP
jgi:hypothetical protein